MEKRECCKGAVEPKLEEDVLYNIAELFKVFGDLTRVKIISVLLEHEMCVCDLATSLDMNQSAISHQLRILKNSHLVKFRREGKQMFYSLDDDHVKLLFEAAHDHVME